MFGVFEELTHVASNDNTHIRMCSDKKKIKLNKKNMIINTNSFFVVLIGKLKKFEKLFWSYLFKNDEIASITQYRLSVVSTNGFIYRT